MSNDYAAIITTVIIAVLVIGSVQFYTFAKILFGNLIEPVKKVTDAEQSVIDSLRSGATPSEELVTAVREARDSAARTKRVVVRLVPATLGTTLWALISGRLIRLQMDVLQWTGTANAGPSPELAQSAFRSTAIAVIILFAEGFARAIAPAVTGFVNESRRHRQITDDEQSQLSRLLRENRESRRTSATSTSGSSGGSD